MSKYRDVERVQRLLRRVDMEEVLGDLGLEVLWTKGADAYLECPDPNHDDANPSFHCCLEETFDSKGRNRLGWFNCWSHYKVGDGAELKGFNFLDLVARIREGIWDKWPTEKDRQKAADWIRARYLGGKEFSPEIAMRRRKLQRETKRGELLWPPSVPIAGAPPEFRRYLEKRNFSISRAIELGARAVRSSGMISSLRRTVPAILFPIEKDGVAVNWYARSIVRRVRYEDKGRYAPDVPLASTGVFWAPRKADANFPIALTEGLLDAERVVRLIEAAPPGSVAVPPGNVWAVLGGRLTPSQARILRSFPSVYVLADGDSGGAKLVDSVEKLMQGFIPIHSRRMPEGTDPDDAPAETVLAALVAEKPAGPRIRTRFRGGSRARL